MRVNDGFVIDADLPALDEEGRGRAKDLSGDCGHCGGNGLVVIDATDPESRDRTASATCSCVHGRWIRAWHATKNRHMIQRLPALADVLAGRWRGWTYRDGLDEPETAPEAPTRAQIARLFRPAGGAA